MNNNPNLNWPQSSIEDITTQCESLSLSSSETDNITLDSGIFFDTKSESKNQKSLSYGGSMYRMLNSAPAQPPPPPPYNSEHNIISRNLLNQEVSQLFQDNNMNNSIPYYNDSVCSIRHSSVNQSNLDSAYLNENSKSQNSKLMPSNPHSLSQRFVNDNNKPIITERSIHHARNKDNYGVINTTISQIFPQVVGQQSMGCAHNNIETHLVGNCSRISQSSNLIHQNYEPKLGKKLYSYEPTDDSKVLGICNKCQYTVTDSESACIALGKFYHSVCFVCSYCNRSLRGKVFYKDHDNVYCENDYMVFGFQKSSKICIACGHIITDSILEALGKAFHPQCFKCTVCEKCLDGIPFTVDQSNNIYCIPDYHLTFAPRCAICCQSITPCNDSDDVVRVVVNDRDFHVDCYRCQNCCKPLTNDSNCFVWTTNRSSVNVKLLCRKCYGDKFRELSRHPQH